MFNLFLDYWEQCLKTIRYSEYQWYRDLGFGTSLRGHRVNLKALKMINRKETIYRKSFISCGWFYHVRLLKIIQISQSLRGESLFG